MTYYQDNHITIYNRDCRSMSELPGESVQCVVTSPPYWGLRKYSGEQELIWGDNHCEHQWQPYKRPAGGGHPSASAQVGATKADVQRIFDGQGAWCSLCGAWKGAYGLEPTPEMYVQHTIEILREIRRVLRKDGVCFWNIGDSYAGSGSPGGDFRDGKGGDEYLRPYNRKGGVLKPKDLCLIPFRLAIAAQEDGWWVRSVIIWSKPNPMPESVTDRPTESHEYILMLTKSGTTQYWTHRDGGGARQKPKADYRWVNQLTQEEVAIEPPDWKVKIKCPECEGEGEVSVYLGLDVWQTIKCPTCAGKKETQTWKRINLWQGHDYYWDADAVRIPIAESTIGRGKVDFGGAKGRDYHPATDDPNYRAGSEQWGRTYEYQGGGRNIRTVWEFPTQPFPNFKIDGRKVDHFAVFPEKLPELCIKAATPEVGCCSKCGAPWERMVKTQVRYRRQKSETEKYPIKPIDGYPGIDRRFDHEYEADRQTIGWQPTCKCNAPRVPSLVLDLFMGAGTTLLVAKKLNRYAIGYELSEDYCQLTVERCRQQVML